MNNNLTTAAYIAELTHELDKVNEHINAELSKQIASEEYKTNVTQNLIENTVIAAIRCIIQLNDQRRAIGHVFYTRPVVTASIGNFSTTFSLEHRELAKKIALDTLSRQ